MVALSRCSHDLSGIVFPLKNETLTQSNFAEHIKSIFTYYIHSIFAKKMKTFVFRVMFITGDHQCHILMSVLSSHSFWGHDRLVFCYSSSFCPQSHISSPWKSMCSFGLLAERRLGWSMHSDLGIPFLNELRKSIYPSLQKNLSGWRVNS